MGNKSLLSETLTIMASIMPKSLPGIAYRTIFKPRPLRIIINWLIKRLIPDRVITTDYILYLNPNDPVVSGAIALEAYEIEAVKFIKKLTRPGMTVLDIGANIGYYSVILGKSVGENGKVYAFEPEPTNFQFLERNIGANSLSHVKAYRLALANKPGILSFYLHESNKGKHSLIDYQKNTECIKVEATTVDSFITKHGIRKIDLIKIDVEGAEPMVFEGMKETLAKHRPIIFTEYFPYAIRSSGRDPLNFLRNLDTLGYRFQIIEDSGTILDITDIKKFADLSTPEIAFNIVCLLRDDQ